MTELKKVPVEKWIIDPVKNFLSNSTTSGIMLFSSALLALIISNSPWSDEYHELWKTHFSVGFGSAVMSKDLHHWINDGLMAVFFFVVGLELKREIIAGELSEPKKALLPLVAAVGGMAIPALIYFAFNKGMDSISGWGIPMATDIAFALGVLYLLGNRVPVALKVFLTALAIADDLGAVLVIAFFYTSEIDFFNLLTGVAFITVLVIANITGVRSTLFYAIIGIGGVWLAFLMSGVHATIAAVLAAATIPADVRIGEQTYLSKLTRLLEKFQKAKPNNRPTVTKEQLHILDDIRKLSKQATTPLQRLEHSMHPFVAFVVMPVFAFSNSGITISGDFVNDLISPVAMGTFFGLFVGKLIGVSGTVLLFLRMGWAAMPEGVNRKQLIGAGFLAGIGFTMSLFISSLAFNNQVYAEQAKIGIFVASILASLIGYTIVKSTLDKPEAEEIVHKSS